MLLGISTDTQDITGTVLYEKEVECSKEDVRQAIMKFVGKIDQVPPMYSALKVNGKKLYELARAGKEVERQARPVTIYELEILDMALPVVKIRVACSKGTYIRTLCADIGAKLGCGGTMKSLLRTKVGIFKEEDAITLAQLEQIRDTVGIESRIYAVDTVFEDKPQIHVEDEFCKLLDNGNPFYANQTVEKKKYPDGEWIRVYGKNKFYGIYAYEQEKHRYKPVKMFLTED